ncbi:MAG: hypothetical protein HUK28_02440 [Methanobrevibacter sp.]|nr:hypothetical protein [Methanobrevibacter sp.]
MFGKKTDFDRKVKELSKKNDIETFKQIRGFDISLKKIDFQMERLSKEKIKDFEINKEPLSNYLEMGSKDPFVDKMRERLDKL